MVHFTVLCRYFAGQADGVGLRTLTVGTVILRRSLQENMRSLTQNCVSRYFSRNLTRASRQRCDFRYASTVTVSESVNRHSTSQISLRNEEKRLDWAVNQLVATIRRAPASEAASPSRDTFAVPSTIETFFDVGLDALMGFRTTSMSFRDDSSSPSEERGPWLQDDHEVLKQLEGAKFKFRSGLFDEGVAELDAVFPTAKAISALLKSLLEEGEVALSTRLLIHFVDAEHVQLTLASVQPWFSSMISSNHLNEAEKVLLAFFSKHVLDATDQRAFKTCWNNLLDQHLRSRSVQDIDRIARFMLSRGIHFGPSQLLATGALYPVAAFFFFGFFCR